MRGARPKIPWVLREEPGILDTPCLIPPHRANSKGYVILKINRKTVRAHKWVWEQANGPVPEGIEVRHRCDNPPCVNLEHLVLGTHAENMADMAERLRSGGAKLTAADVQEIRAALRAGESQRPIARRYGVRQSAISAIRRKESWAWLPEEKDTD